MNILVIGNGFDIAHGLPTKYTDFLEFCRMIYYFNDFCLCKSVSTMWKELNLKISNKEDVFIEFLGEFQYLEEKKGLVAEEITKYQKYTGIRNAVKDNIWIKYFLKNAMYQKENWIDFESEISKVIQAFDEFRRKVSNGKGISGIQADTEKILVLFLENTGFALQRMLHDVSVIDELINFLEIELEKLIWILEFYIVKFVDSVTITKRSVDIEKINSNCILSFNYSNTYERLYDINTKIDYHYIHGKANVKNIYKFNNMVLGIDEYLSEKKKNNETHFIAFKKFYQRIHKGTGCEYKNWIYKIEESAKTTKTKLRSEYPRQIPLIKFDNNEKHNLYIFGHSLDVTDKDILRDLIINDNVYTTIYYRKISSGILDDDNGRKDLGTKIANLVKIIGQDELLRRTGGSTKTIEFVMQEPMKGIKQNRVIGHIDKLFLQTQNP